MSRGLIIFFVVLFIGAHPSLLLAASPAGSSASPDLVAAIEGMRQQMSQMREMIEKQNLRIQELESQRVLVTAQSNAPVQPATQPISSTLTGQEPQKNIKDNIGEAIPWLKGAKFAGDIRLRYDGLNFYDKNNNDGEASKGLDADHNKFRIRLRWGFEKDYGDDWTAGFRIATGNNTDPTGTNFNLGSPGYFTYKSINVDRAYAQYTPKSMKNYGSLREVTVGAGKFENPFQKYSTTIMWDPDVTPEGAFEKATVQLVSAENDKVNLVATAGQLIVNESTAKDTNANIFAFQTAVNWSTDRFGGKLPVDLINAISYYDFTNWRQTVASNTAGTSYLRTNTYQAGNFRVLDIYPQVNFYVDRTPVSLWYDFAKNLGLESTPSGDTISDKDTAWGVGFKLGKMKDRGNWEFFYGYYEIGANAVPAAFNDSDFGGPGEKGYTNRAGHKFGLGYQLTDSLGVNWTNYLVTPLDVAGASVVAYSTSEKVFRTQLDLTFKF